jgi:hypothetical protein
MQTSQCFSIAPKQHLLKSFNSRCQAKFFCSKCKISQRLPLFLGFEDLFQCPICDNCIEMNFDSINETNLSHSQAETLQTTLVLGA